MNALGLCRCAAGSAAGVAVAVGLFGGGALSSDARSPAAKPGVVAAAADTHPAHQGPTQGPAQAGTRIVPAPPGGPREGIRVHGHWVIEVRNRDGSLASRTEFDNAFNGVHIPALLLTRERSVGLWMILLQGTTNPGPCGAPGTPSYCPIYEPSVPHPFALKTLTVANGGIVGVADSVKLTCTLTATNDSDPGKVSTFLSYCDAATAPANCLAIPSGDRLLDGFTQANFAPINVVAGQIIQITVVISFS